VQGERTDNVAVKDRAPADGPAGARKAPPSNGRPPEDQRKRPGLVERLLLRPRLWHLRRRRNAHLKQVAGLTVELYRLDSPRQRELARGRLEGAAEIDRELLELERQLDPDHVGGRCSGCGLYSRRTRFCLRCGEQLPGRRSTEALTVSGALLAISAIAIAWLLGGVNLGTQKEGVSTSAGNRTAVSSRGPVRPAFSSVVASVKGPTIGVYRSPHSGSPFTTLDNPNLDGAPLVFLVRKMQKGWARVLLPIRPNGSTGWIKLSNVKLAGHNYRLTIDLGSHRLTVYKAAKRVLKTPVGVGRAVTPTPPGLYYITELLKQPDPTGTYGPYAFGLSAHSNVLNEFAGADGVLGIHGTNFPQGIGTDVSHGCIRLSNRAILKLARSLPVGTPVRIRNA
jgi:lipoprotein-anchoring transpeptidase ErfK/SrfK